MRGLQRSSRRFLFQNILLFILTGTFAFLGVYFTGRSAYRSANELGAMTADYLNLQVNSFMSQYQQILEDASYMVNTMLQEDVSPAEIEQWVTAYSQQYEQTMQYDESGIYGVIRGEGIYSSGWRPGSEYNIQERPGTSRRWPQAENAPAPWSTRTPCPRSTPPCSSALR